MLNRYQDVSIIYGGKGRKYAEELDQRIRQLSDRERYPIASTIMMESILTGELLNDVMDLFRKSEFCVAFLTADDICLCEGQEKYRIRQNILLELGMALITLGRERCIILSDFDPRAEGMELPSDMNSLEIFRFEEEDLRPVIDTVIEKILKLTKVSLTMGTEQETIPRYDGLLTREEYLIDYENMFVPQLFRWNTDGRKFFVTTLEEWYDECASLPHFDERCIYLLERLGLLPIFGPIPEVNDFMFRSAKLVENYKKWDIRYYKDQDLLDFGRDLVANVIEYTQIKTGPDVDDRMRYEKLKDAFLMSEIPAGTVNPLMKVVYYDYLGLTWLRLYRNGGTAEELQRAQDAFVSAMEELGNVDMSLRIWAGFLTYNIARTFAYQGNYEKAETYFKKAIQIRERWIRTSTFNSTIRNALSSEYFLAKLEAIDMRERSARITKAEADNEYRVLEAELNAYSDFADRADALLKIRKRVYKRKVADDRRQTQGCIR